jgi:hypothetical protein
VIVVDTEAPAPASATGTSFTANVRCSCRPWERGGAC